MRNISFVLGLILFPGLCLLGGALSVEAAFSPEHAGFRVQGNQRILIYNTESLFVLPGETVNLEVLEKGGSEEYLLAAPGCVFKTVKAATWEGTAPVSPGLYSVQLKRVSDQQSLHVQMFVLVPFTALKNGKIQGYNIGNYPVPQGRVAGYGLPPGFVEVTAANREAFVSPHFQLKQFLCKESHVGLQYVVLRPELLDKLEKILEQLNLQGHTRQTLRLLSAYRTPYYNQMIHDARFSAHQWGLAADIYLEGDTSAREDDLNHDGCVDVHDAEMLFSLVDAWETDPDHTSLIGGIGLYPRTSEHGPFVHIDARGYSARWAQAPARLPGPGGFKPTRQSARWMGTPARKPARNGGMSEI
ncbi:MAG: hypothetical protein HGA76_04520 [Candidatus Firestonebacteria bacterium]|nr:hypothetical protein [Candidatus Firestonebacteria bacterium]